MTNKTMKFNPVLPKIFWLAFTSSPILFYTLIFYSTKDVFSVVDFRLTNSIGTRFIFFVIFLMMTPLITPILAKKAMKRKYPDKGDERAFGCIVLPLLLRGVSIEFICMLTMGVCIYLKQNISLPIMVYTFVLMLLSYPGDNKVREHLGK